MQLSIVGLLTLAGLWFAMRRSEEPVLSALIASLAFGATAIIVLPALGGASPLIYVVLLAILLVITALRASAVRDLTTVVVRQPEAWVVALLALYVAAGAVLLPRIFAGVTSVFVPVRDEARIAEVALGPVSGNITQSLYFIAGALCFFAVSMLLRDPRKFNAIRRGLFGFAMINVCLGFIDLMAKVADLGDVLAPFRTASYNMLTNAEVAGFYRISGGYAEASIFGSVSAGLLAFTYTYYRETKERRALALSMALAALLLLSTSSTAYLLGAILAMAALFGVVMRAINDRLEPSDLGIFAAAAFVLALLTGIILTHERFLDPIISLFNSAIFDKASSSSALERAYWNFRSLESLLETFGLGVGMGSSRASSWAIAVVSQLGFIGVAMLGYLLFKIIAGGRIARAPWIDMQTRGTVLGMRAAVLTMLIASTISGGGADPGIIFFMTLAVVSSLCSIRSFSGVTPMPHAPKRMPATTSGGIGPAAIGAVLK